MQDFRGVGLATIGTFTGRRPTARRKRKAASAKACDPQKWDETDSDRAPAYL